MADQFLSELPLLNISSVTNINSLFMYVEEGTDPFLVDGDTMSRYMLGMPRHFATKFRTDSYDLAPDTYWAVEWTNTLSDSYGFVDSNSSTLFRVPDDRIVAVQLFCCINVEESTFGERRVRYQAGGLPSGGMSQSISFSQEEDHHSTDNLFHIVHIAPSPIIKVTSGSYFYAEVRHGHSVNRKVVDNVGHSGTRENYFSILAWETAN